MFLITLKRILLDCVLRFLYVLDSLSSWVFAVDSCLKDWYYYYFVWVRNGFRYPVLVPWHVNIPKHFCVKGNSTLLLLFIFLLYFLVVCQVKILIFSCDLQCVSFDNTWQITYLKSTKTAVKRSLLFINEDDPFGNIKRVTKIDMTWTTLQRAKVFICTYFNGFLKRDFNLLKVTDNFFFFSLSLSLSLPTGCPRSRHLNWTSSLESAWWGVQCFSFLCCMDMAYFDLLSDSLVWID